MESGWPTSMEISKRVLVKKAYHPNASSGTPGRLPPPPFHTLEAETQYQHGRHT